MIIYKSQIIRCIEKGDTIRVGDAVYKGANPEFRWIPGKWPLGTWKKVTKGIPFVRITPRRHQMLKTEKGTERWLSNV